VMCSYKRLAERNSQTHTMHRLQVSDGPDGSLGWLQLNSSKLTTYLLDVQQIAMREHEMMSYTWTTLKAETRGAQTHCARWPIDWTLYGCAYHLWVLIAQPGSCHSPGTWNLRWLLHLQKLCAPLV
jgi:hypothetical protein